MTTRAAAPYPATKMAMSHTGLSRSTAPVASSTPVPPDAAVHRPAGRTFPRTRHPSSSGMEPPSAVADHLARQDGLVTRVQLRNAGVSQDTIAWNAGRHWWVVLPCVYLVRRDNPTERQRQIGGLLWAGAGAALAGATSAGLHGVRSANPGGRVHLLVPAPKRSRSNTFAVVRRTTLHDEDTVSRGVLVLSSPARSCVDAALQSASADTRSAIFVEAVQRQIVTIDQLGEWVHRLRPRDGARVRSALDDAATGAWSLPELALLDLVSTSTVLPEPSANPSLLDAEGRRLLTPDVWFDDVAMAVMVHSHAFHSQGADWDATVERDGGLVEAGVVVAGVTPHRLRTQPRSVLRRLEQTYLTAAKRPRPAVCATPQHVGLLARDSA